MKLSSFRNLIRFMMVALLSTSVAVGCGQGKHKRRQPIKNGKTAIDPKTGQPIVAKMTPEQEKKAADNLKNKSGLISTIEAQVKQLKTGTQMSATSIEDGTYTLEGVTTYYSYMNTKNSDDVRIYRAHGVTATGDLTDSSPAQTTGYIGNFSDAGRKVEVPFVININRSQNPDFTTVPGAFQRQVLLRTEAILNTKDTTMDLRDKTEAYSGSGAPRASVTAMLAGAANMNKENKLTITDEFNKEVVLSLVKVSDTKTNIVFEIVESQTPMVVRNIILSYNVVKAAKAAAAEQQQGQQQQVEGAVQQPVDQGAAGTQGATGVSGAEQQQGQGEFNAIKNGDDDQLLMPK